MVGERVREARLRLQPPLDQADLAAALSDITKLPYGRTTVSRLESGQRPVSDYEVVALAKTLGVSVTWLLLGE